MTVDVKKIKRDNNETGEQVIIPETDIFVSDDEYMLKADIPGVKKDNLNVTLHDNILEINGTYSKGELNQCDLKYCEYNLVNYYRSFKVGNEIDGGNISASVDDGVLTLKLPKRPEVKPRRIQINAV